MKRSKTIIAASVICTVLVAVIALPALAGSGGKSCGSAAVASESCPATKAADVVASADGQKACGTDKAVASKSCAPKQAADVVASVDGKKACGSDKAVASKSCAAKQAADVLASVDDDQKQAKVKKCTGCKEAMAQGAMCGKCAHHKTEAAIEKLDAVEAAIKAGNEKEALAALATAREALQPVQKMAAKAVATADAHKGHKHHADKNHDAKGKEGLYANAKCPTMGSPIHAKNVKDSLTRQFKGQTVAFCCGGCPAAWDKLSAEDKAAKLKAIK
ncbi:MAG: hypothetical protein ACLFUJ_03445 [Phycisphaerae bacterium]